MEQNGKLCMWVVYDRPLDFPNEAVARLFALDDPTELILRAESVEALRERISQRNPDLYCVPRQSGDEPHIVEVWL